MPENKNLEDKFLQFNESRKVLSKQFHDLIEIVGNKVFHGKINISNPNIMEEINNQENLLEPEKNVLRHLHFYSSNLLNSRFLLGVLGRFKAGKSTLLNALASENISPMDTRISTGVLNFTYWNEKEECIVAYDSGQEMEIDPEDKVSYVDFRYNPDNEKCIHSVRHGSPKLDLQKEIIFVDTPGLEAVNRVHEKITLDFVSQCHSALVVSTYPPFGEGELQFYDRIKEVIPNIFLVQNLPEDKLIAWVELETQTLHNLYKLGFYEYNTDVYEGTEIRDILNKIADRKDQKALQKFKNIHSINLYSLNAKMAFEALQLEHDQEEKKEILEKDLEESRFSKFKSDLYEFLAGHKGSKLIEDYIQKGSLVLKELISMVESRKNLLLKSLAEIEEEIKEQEYNKEKTNTMLEMMVDRTNLKIIESYKNLKSDIMDGELARVMDDLNKNYGDINIFRLRKGQLKKIKEKIGEFNRIFGQKFKECVKQAERTIGEAQEKIAETIENHGIFSKAEIATSCSPVSMGEIARAGSIDYGFALAFRGSMAYIVGSIAGGTGIALLSPILGTGALSLSVGAAIGVGLSLPLEKHCAPVLEFGKNLISRWFNKPVKSIFDNFRSNVREKLDEVELIVVDRIVNSFKVEVTQNTNEYFSLFTKRLEELKNKKAHGMTQEDCERECDKLQGIIEQLESINTKFLDMEKVEDSGSVQGLFKGIKGYLKKMTQNK